MLLNQIKQESILGSLVTLLAYIYGLISTPLFWIIIFLISIDFLVGLYAAVKNKELDWSCTFDGIIRKLFLGILIFISAVIDYALNFYGIYTAGLFHNFIMGAIIVHELGSIINNSDKAGFWVPQLFKEANKKMRLNNLSKK